jgi:phage baseplate assembly protein W
MTQLTTNAISENLGKGLKWPLNLTNGKADLVENLDLLKQSIQIILNWYFGTRFYLGEFGSRLEELLEEPNTSLLKTTVDHELGKTIPKWEPRVVLIKTKLETPTRDTLKISIHYQIAKTQLVDNFTFEYKINQNY